MVTVIGVRLELQLHVRVMGGSGGGSKLDLVSVIEMLTVGRVLYK